jgi:hypothetical protein
MGARAELGHLSLLGSGAGCTLQRHPRGQTIDTGARHGHSLWHGARVRSTDRGDHRGAPSAGSLHPIHWLVLEPPFSCACVYDPFRHALGEISGVDPRELEGAARELRDSLPAAEGTFLVAVAEAQRTTAIYEYPDSLIWRDAGCALATMHLVASWLGLGSCLLGVLGTSVAKLVDANDGIAAVGVLAVGEVNAAARM